MSKEEKKCFELFKVDCLDPEKITKVAQNQDLSIPEKILSLYADIPMTHDQLKDIQFLLFVLEAIVLSDGMRDKRLSNLDQSQLEDLVFDLFFSVEIERCELAGYGEMGDVANEVIEKHLSRKSYHRNKPFNYGWK